MVMVAEIHNQVKVAVAPPIRFESDPGHDFPFATLCGSDRLQSVPLDGKVVLRDDCGVGTGCIKPSKPRELH